MIGLHVCPDCGECEMYECVQVTMGFEYLHCQKCGSNFIDKVNKKKLVDVGLYERAKKLITGR